MDDLVEVGSLQGKKLQTRRYSAPTSVIPLGQLLFLRGRYKWLSTLTCCLTCPI